MLRSIHHFPIRLRVGVLSERDLLIAGIALHAGEGTKRDGTVSFANSDPAMVAFFCRWIRTFFDIDESRWLVSLYLHEGLDLGASQLFWSEVTTIPVGEFLKACRAVADVGIRNNTLEHGCVSIRYSCTRTHRTVMGLVKALLRCPSHSGVAQLAEQGTVNAKAVGSSPTPGAQGR